MDLSSSLPLLSFVSTVTLLWPTVCHGFETECVSFHPVVNDTDPAFAVTCKRKMKYNTTVRNNAMLDDSNHFQLAKRLEDYGILVQSKCHDWLFTFLCMMHFPPCVPKGIHKIETAVYPCRNFCLTVQSACEPYIRAFARLSWPESFACTRLLAYGECFQPNHSLPTVYDLWGTVFVPDFTSVTTTPAPEKPADVNLPDRAVASQTIRSLKNSCPSPLRTNHSQFKFANVKYCGVPCSGVYFTKWQRQQFAPVWILTWAILCVLSCLFTLCTYFIDRKRLTVAESNIVAITFCYFGLGVVHIGVYASKESGRNVACDSRYDRIFQQTSSRDVPCMAVFMLLYYFTMVAFLNWIFLTLYWFLSSAMEWTTERISDLSLYLRLFAWITPGLQVVAVLVFQKVDGDQLASVCFVGQSDTTGQAVFLVAPLILFLLIGVLLLGSAACGRQSVLIASAEGGREEIRAKRLQSPQERKLVARVGMFSVFFALLASLQVGTLIYEAVERQSWEKTVLNCYKDRSSLSCTQGSKPHIAAFLMKYAATFFMGITSGFWVWSNKTLEVWKKWLGCFRKTVWTVPKK